MFSPLVAFNAAVVNSAKWTLRESHKRENRRIEVNFLLKQLSYNRNWVPGTTPLTPFAINVHTTRIVLRSSIGRTISSRYPRGQAFARVISQWYANTWWSSPLMKNNDNLLDCRSEERHNRRRRWYSSKRDWHGYNHNFPLYFTFFSAASVVHPTAINTTATQLRGCSRTCLPVAFVPYRVCPFSTSCAIPREWKVVRNSETPQQRVNPGETRDNVGIL